VTLRYDDADFELLDYDDVGGMLRDLREWAESQIGDAPA
jgi:hypothetical protein